VCAIYFIFKINPSQIRKPKLKGVHQKIIQKKIPLKNLFLSGIGYYILPQGINSA